MRFPYGFSAGLAVLLVGGCGGSETAQPNEFRAELNRVGPDNARTHLTGDEEVPPTGSAAQGQAVYRLSPDGTSIHFRVLVANIDNTLMAHIHMAPPGVNVGIVQLLRPSRPPPVLVPGRFG